ncbi:MAG: glycosyltransferase family 4 protein, partial [Thermodesulfovibrio sp.]|nr:glycosyltransferase family 4 protein [Thermodesulfovibrio sp.]
MKDKLKIAQVAPVIERVPPPKYGGVELVVGNLVEGLHKRGHEITLFATGDSICPQKLISVTPKPMRGMPQKEIYRIEFLQAAKVFEMASEFDIIHCHFGPDVFPYYYLTELTETPFVFTLHGRLDLPQLREFYRRCERVRRCYHISISNDQRIPLPEANYVGTVYNGIDVKKYPFSETKEDFLIFLGRSSPEKGIVEAIEVAKKAGEKLYVFAKVDPVDKEYFESKVKPMIDGDQIVFKGEVEFEEKVSYLAKAKAMLFPIQWREPFGLVMIEAMACGTPVIAPERASVPEIIIDKVTGFIVSQKNMIDEMVEKIKYLNKIDPKKCREHVEKNFNSDRMVEDYLSIYRWILKNHKPF